MTSTLSISEVGILLYPGAQMSSVLSMTDLFVVSNRFSGPAGPGSIRVSHWEADATSSPRCVFDTMPGSRSDPSVLILPPSLTTPSTADTGAPYVDWIREHFHKGSIVASVCAGAFPLGETGLLNGRFATTHWAYEEEFSARFPSVKLDVDRLLVDEGQILTAGGVMSWTDLCLRLLERLRGAEVMTQTARFLLVDPPGREQRYYHLFSPRMSHGDTAVLKAQEWLQEMKAQDVSLEALAAVAGLERRTFLRRFRRATGMTTSEYAQRLRVSKACELLQFGQLNVDEIAWKSGYQDPAAFRKIFHRYVGLTPGEYRRRFGAFQKEPAAGLSLADQSD